MTIQHPILVRIICFVSGLCFLFWSVSSLYSYFQTAYFKQSAEAEVIGYGRVGMGPVRPKLSFEFKGKKYMSLSMNFPLRIFKSRKPYAIGEIVSIGFDSNKPSFVAIKNWSFWIIYVIVLLMSFILFSIGIKGMPKKKSA
ncbi:MAG: DUF3592 domain-containing protein [Chitinophagaceae bacterium]|jgi:hypothetical protein|uniref:hypothetical protein n=1 Tax=unclassified Paraflavitalea TaxID=2798305 RepID=UPI003D3268E5|nr:DUF3592 domain-containing protein [Chitinophagaceae bacterium]